MLYLPEKGIKYPNDPHLEIISQLSSDNQDSYIEVYRKNCIDFECDDARCKQDIFKVIWKNDQIDEESDWDERDIIDTISVLSSALSVEAQRKNI